MKCHASQAGSCCGPDGQGQLTCILHKALRSSPALWAPSQSLLSASGGTAGLRDSPSFQIPDPELSLHLGALNPHVLLRCTVFSPRGSWPCWREEGNGHPPSFRLLGLLKPERPWRPRPHVLSSDKDPRHIRLRPRSLPPGNLMPTPPKPGKVPGTPAGPSSLVELRFPPP